MESHAPSAQDPVDAAPPGEGTQDFSMPPAPQLAAATLEDFLAWAVSVRQGAVDHVRSAIAEAADRRDETLVIALTDELHSLPVEDVSRHMVLLATIGELRDARLSQALESFVWRAELVREPYLADGRGCSFEVRSDVMLRSRAAEMLAYLASDDADSRTLRIAEAHPEPAVRAAAVDAYLFNHGDTEDALRRVQAVVRADDASRVGVPRFTRDIDPDEFAAAVEEFYRRHPDQLPPGIHDGPAPQDRVATTKEAGDV